MRQKTSLFICLSFLSLTHAYANDVFSPDRQYLLGDWNGKRGELAQQGVEVNVSLLNEAATNLKGGYNDDTTVRSPHQWTFGSSLDLDKLWGWENTTAKLSITKRDGLGLSSERIADPRAKQFSNVEEVNGRDQVWRLSQAWLQKNSVDKKISVKVGRMNIGEDFNSAQCEFQNLTLCGAQVGKTANIWYNWPITVWAANIKYNLSPELMFSTGIYESNAENLKKNKGFNLSTDGSKGVILPVELTWKPHLTDLAGLYRFGAFYSTADAVDVLTDGSGHIQLSPSKREVHDGKYNVWFVGQQQLTEHQGDSKRGLTAYLNFNFNDKATSQLIGSEQIALIYKGAFDARPNDSVGFGVARSQVNKRYRESQIAKNEHKQVFDYDNPLFTPLEYAETNIELNYTVNVSPSIMIRPNLQFVHQAGGLKEVDDAWVLGLTTRLNF